ncbi:MAG: hypothetical protein JXA15_03275 [Spirochaetales bacterium]|nr:hypothetical protein [Spirochaetales bacterium]
MDRDRHIIAALLRTPPVPAVIALVVLPFVNIGFNRLILFSSVPLFLDSIGTAVSAAVFGLPLGLGTAILTNAFQELFEGFAFRHLPFAICGMATALLTWLETRRRREPLIARFSLLTLSVALANALLGAVVATFVFGGGTGANIDVIVAGFALAFRDVFSAAFLARIPANLVDKAPAALLALLAARALGAGERPMNGRLRGASRAWRHRTETRNQAFIKPARMARRATAAADCISSFR